MQDRIVERLWIRPEAGGPVEPREHLRLVAGEGIEGDHTYGRSTLVQGFSCYPSMLGFAR